jgi:diaminopimelate decarboxylase
VAFRVNPDVDAKTHPYISTGLRQSKFGVAYADAERLYREAARNRHVEVTGIGCHIGSLMMQAAPFAAAAERIVVLVDRLAAVGAFRSRMWIWAAASAPATVTRRRRRSPSSCAPRWRALGERRQTLIVDPGARSWGCRAAADARQYLKPGEAKNFVVVGAA